MRADSSPAPRRPDPDLARPFADLLDAASGILLGKRSTLTLALTAVLAEGHLLLEDHPGTGKTLLAASLARLLGLGFRRLQFTSDLLPADIVGSQVYDAGSGSFRFVPGPVFTPFLLADEINRATPRTQSALLEAMEERQVSVDGETRPLPRPFVVVATQNPGEQTGTYPLPESQLDRFLLRLELGYPDPEHEKALWSGEDPRERLARLRPRVDGTTLLAAQANIRALAVAPAVLDYTARLVARTRADPALSPGLSPRAGRALLAAARAHAFLAGRGAPWPDDIKAVFVAVSAHRLGREGARAAAARLEAILETTLAA
jgi:MoxR-like ATPase